ncbi:MAG: magnesium/cobalt transporter CorA [Aigarchaeota archaeon]|nr:magnesium/cobalt transporter CorA [Aigarchaeota archaeon]MCX8192855.1 magnesium/cobalt transporter CorA [Nitrososphaeria archaeon]MDW7986583.1 magnesium/cobalt transporter CorA [Nitrososphaerota archaeon]
MAEETLNEIKNTIVKIVEYDENSFQEKLIKDLDECKLQKDSFKVGWIQVVGLEDKEVVKKLGERFGLHQLTLEDILTLDQRAKIEEFYNYTYIALRIFYYNHKERNLSSEQLSIVISSNSIITFEERKSKLLNDIEDQIKYYRGIVRRMGVDYLLYLIMDSVVDYYFDVLENIEESVQKLENELTSNPTSKTLQSIHRLKRNLILLQKNMWPLREVVGKLDRAGYKFVKEQSAPFFRDLYDHVVTVIENVEMLHLQLSDMLDIYFSAVSTKLNEVMKVLTMIATIFMPLTFIAGIYGMNFEYMPELKLVWGYPAVLLIMLGVGLWMVFHFKRKGWI